MSKQSTQLPLSIQLDDNASFSNFYTTPSNSLAISHVEQLGDTAQEWFLFLHGPKGVGKSHLLQAACQQSDQSGKRALYLPLLQLKTYTATEVCTGLAEMDLLCLDDIDAVLADPDWCETLFTLFNQLHENGKKLLVAAASPASQLPCALADLRSRLSWGATFALQTLSDEERLAMLQARAAQRGLNLSDEVGQYLLHRSSRDTNSLLAMLDTLDTESLRQQRNLTIPFIRDVMGW